MCNVGEAISRAFSSGNTQATAMLAQQQAAQTAEQTASDAMAQAIQRMQQAAVPAIDNPSAQAAQKSQMARALAARGGAWSFGNTPTVAPTVGTKMLLGA